MNLKETEVVLPSKNIRSTAETGQAAAIIGDTNTTETTSRTTHAVHGSGYKKSPFSL